MISSFKAVDDGTELSLRATHDIQNAQHKTRIPDNVDVVLATNARFTLSGSHNGHQVSPHTIMRAHIASHLVDYLGNNASRLGLANVSPLHMDGTPSITINSSRRTAESARPQLVLSAIHISYHWKTASSPFTRSLSASLLSLLDNVLDRFVKHHLVKRYPLAFGTWFPQLDIENELFPKILRSILALIKRSQNPAFRSACKRHLKNIKRTQEAVITSSTGSMSSWLSSSESSCMQSASCESQLSIEDAFCSAMDGCYRAGIRKPTFKSATSTRSLPPPAIANASETHSPEVVPDNPFGVDPELAAKSLLQTADLFSSLAKLDDTRLDLFNYTSESDTKHVEFSSSDAYSLSEQLYEDSDSIEECCSDFDLRSEPRDLSPALSPALPPIEHSEFLTDTVLDKAMDTDSSADGCDFRCCDEEEPRIDWNDMDMDSDDLESVPSLTHDDSQSSSDNPSEVSTPQREWSSYEPSIAVFEPLEDLVDAAVSDECIPRSECYVGLDSDSDGEFMMQASDGEHDNFVEVLQGDAVVEEGIIEWEDGE